MTCNSQIELQGFISCTVFGAGAVTGMGAVKAGQQQAAQTRGKSDKERVWFPWSQGRVGSTRPGGGERLWKAGEGD